NGAGARKNGFQERRLAALERAHQRDAPGTLGFIAVLTGAVLSHAQPPTPAGRSDLLSRPFAISSQAPGRLARVPAETKRPPAGGRRERLDSGPKLVAQADAHDA